MQHRVQRIDGRERVGDQRSRGHRPRPDLPGQLRCSRVLVHGRKILRQDPPERRQAGQQIFSQIEEPCEVVEIVMEETGELPLAVAAMAGLGDGLLGHDEEEIQVRGDGGGEHARP